MSPTVTLPSESMSAMQSPEHPNSLKITNKSDTFTPPSPLMSPGQQGGSHEPSSKVAVGSKLQALMSVQPYMPEPGSMAKDLKPEGAVIGRLWTLPE